MVRMTKAEVGQFVYVVWGDIVVDASGNPDKAHLTYAGIAGIYDGVRKDKGIEVVVLRLERHRPGEEADNRGQAGWWCVPKQCIKQVYKLSEPQWWDDAEFKQKEDEG
jgi:hypothetical protein